ncbi:hypothetical protein K1719_020637 [Acacia pycnantha]|nr:hypothetical protein K1719_020637 [Acacia pycnantha]
MPRKKKPGDEPKDKQPLHEEEEDQQSYFQDAQNPISSQELQEIIKHLLQQQTPSPKGSTSQTVPQIQGSSQTVPQIQGSSQTVPQTQGSRLQTRSQTKSGSSTPKTESQTQRLTSSKPGRKTTDSYAKKPPNQTWEEVLAKKDNKTQALEHDRALALSLIASSSQAINKQEYDLANAKFALELAQKRPPQVPTPLLVTPANNPLDTPYIAKLAQVQHVQKTREYYELILVHSQSIELTRYISKEDETLITHSTLQIVKVLTPSQWGQDLSKPKYFDIKYEPKGYNYGTIIKPGIMSFGIRIKFSNILGSFTLNQKPSTLFLNGFNIGGLSTDQF